MKLLRPRCAYMILYICMLCVKCGDVYIHTHKLYLKYICIIHVCVWNMYLHTIPLFYTYVCFSYIVYYIYIYMRVCVCKQLVVCSSDPYVCRLQQKNDCFGTYSGFV